MEFLNFILSASVREISATAVLVAVVWLILTGRLVPRRQLKDAQEVGEAWHSAHTVSETARSSLQMEQFKLLETARISNQFYRDFLPAVDENTHPKRQPVHPDSGGTNVAV